MGGGLKLGVMGGVHATATDSGYSSGNGASTASGAAFGPNYDNTSTPGIWSALKPDDAFGTSFWIAIFAVAGLVAIRHSLPR